MDGDAGGLAVSGQWIADSGLYRPASPTHYCHLMYI